MMNLPQKNNLFEFVSCQKLKAQYRGFSALFLQNYEETPRRNFTQIPPLSIHSVVATVGHICLTFRNGTIFAVFDAVPGPYHLDEEANDNLTYFFRLFSSNYFVVFV